MARRKGSARWLKEHFRDPYVRGAQRAGYRSRAAYKLAEIDRGERLLTSGLIVVDLGAAPGGWSQYAAERVGAGGRVFALDLRPMDPLEGVTFIQGDFREDEPLERIRALLGGRGVGLVISDMAPNISGIDTVDQPRAMHLSELAADLAAEVLEPGGSLLTKAFQGEGFDAWREGLRARYGRVKVIKPRASRARSRELYVLARDFKL